MTETSPPRIPNTFGYGRYADDPNHVGCPRAGSDMTPCVARDGRTALAEEDSCVGCGSSAADLLRDLVRGLTEPIATSAAPDA